MLSAPQSRPSDWHIDASRIAQSLCGHLLSADEAETARDKQALAHYEALRVIMEKDIRGTGGDYGARFLQILSIEN